MELLQNLPDDQVALLGCFVAFVASGILLSISYYLGPNPRRSPSSAALTPQSRPMMGQLPPMPRTDGKRADTKAA